MLLGALLVFFMFPRRDEEQQLLERYHAEDVAADEPHLRKVATHV